MPQDPFPKVFLHLTFKLIKKQSSNLYAKQPTSFFGGLWKKIFFRQEQKRRGKNHTLDGKKTNQPTNSGLLLPV